MILTKAYGSVVNRTMVLGLLVALMAVGLLLVPIPIHAATTFAVNLTGDQADFSGSDGRCDTDGNASNGLQCTLRAAIEQANATTGADTINFAIPGLGVKTVFVASELPTITEAVTINGYSQPGSSANTLAKGTNANILIELNLAGAGGLEIEANNTVVRGLVINSSRGSGISVESGTGNRIEGNFLGTDATGTLDRGNHGFGAQIDGGGANTVGGTSPAQRNLISGNGFEGIEISSNSSGSNTVQGNLIGTQRDGVSPLGNSDEGIYVDSPNNTIGGTGLGEANVIAFNGDEGVFVEFVEGNTLNTGNRISANSIFSNGRLGIDLDGGTENAAGTTRNDPKDADVGANDLQNKPVITSATNSGGKTTIQVKLNSTPRDAFVIEFYSNVAGDEGEKFIGNKAVSTNSNGTVTFSFSPSRKVAPGQKITATATNVVEANTSEFSAPGTVASS